MKFKLKHLGSFIFMFLVMLIKILSFVVCCPNKLLISNYYLPQDWNEATSQQIFTVPIKLQSEIIKKIIVNDDYIHNISHKIEE